MVIGQRKQFCRQRIPEPSCARKEAVDVDILITSRNVDRKIMQLIRMTGPPMRMKKWNKFSQCRWTSTKVMSAEKTSTVYILTKFKSLREASIERLLHTRSLSNISKQQLGLSIQTGQQYSTHGCMVDL